MFEYNNSQVCIFEGIKLNGQAAPVMLDRPKQCIPTHQRPPHLWVSYTTNDPTSETDRGVGVTLGRLVRGTGNHKESTLRLVISEMVDHKSTYQ